MSEYIEGKLLREEELEKFARERRKKQEILLVPKPAEPANFPGYTVVGETKTKVRLARSLEPWRQFENEVWLLLKRFGFTEMNGSGNLYINAKNLSKPESVSTKFQIDVFGRADDNVFVIECKTKEMQGTKSLKTDIDEFALYRSSLQNAVRRHYGDSSKKLNVSFIIATQNIAIGETELKRAHEHGIFIWQEHTLRYFRDIAGLFPLIGEAARYQLYAVMLFLSHHPRKSVEDCICASPC
jgi:Holliday junction resolvase